MEVAERFTVPYWYDARLALTQYESEKAQQALKLKGYEVAKYAISKYERLHHWTWFKKIPPVIDYSDAQYDFSIFANPLNTNLAVNQGQLLNGPGDVAFVIKLWFIVPKIRVEVITPEATDPGSTDGFVNPYYMPEFVSLKEGFVDVDKVEINATT